MSAWLAQTRMSFRPDQSSILMLPSARAVTPCPSGGGRRSRSWGRLLGARVVGGAPAQALGRGEVRRLDLEEALGPADLRVPLLKLGAGGAEDHEVGGSADFVVSADVEGAEGVDRAVVEAEMPIAPPDEDDVHAQRGEEAHDVGGVDADGLVGRLVVADLTEQLVVLVEGVEVGVDPGRDAPGIALRGGGGERAPVLSVTGIVPLTIAAVGEPGRIMPRWSLA